jgi:Protein of unknown function (DUF2845)
MKRAWPFRTIVAGLLVFPVLGLGLHAAAVSSFPCENGRHVRIGQHLTEVLDICGEPDVVSRRLEQRRYKYKTGRRCSCHDVEISEERVIEVQVDELMYDFGPNRHVRHLRFENDFLSSIYSRWVGAR